MQLLKTHGAAAGLPPSQAPAIRSHPNSQTPQDVPCSQTHLLASAWAEEEDQDASSS